MNTINPIVSTPEYKSLVEQYKTMLQKYQPGDWYFGAIERGERYNEETQQWDNSMTIELMKERLAKVSPVGPEVPLDEVEDVTMHVSGMFYNEKNYGADTYHVMQAWLNTQDDIFCYSRGNEDFSSYQAFKIASKLGYKKVFMENLS